MFYPVNALFHFTGHCPTVLKVPLKKNPTDKAVILETIPNLLIFRGKLLFQLHFVCRYLKQEVKKKLPLGVQNYFPL